MAKYRSGQALRAPCGVYGAGAEETVTVLAAYDDPGEETMYMVQTGLGFVAFAFESSLSDAARDAA